MDKRLVKRGACDGFAQSAFLYLLQIYAISVFSPTSSADCLKTSVFGSVLSAVCYFLLTYRISSNKSLLYLSSISVGGFLVTTIVMVVSQNVLGWSVLLLRETNSADGILLMLVSVAFLVLSAILRLSLLCGLILRNKYKQKRKPNT